MENSAGLMHHSWGAMLEPAARDSPIVPGDVFGSGTVTGGSVGEARRTEPGYRPAISNPAILSRLRSRRSGSSAPATGPPGHADPSYGYRAPTTSDGIHRY